MDRRTFLKSLGAAAAARLLPLGQLLGRRECSLCIQDVTVYERPLSALEVSRLYLQRDFAQSHLHADVEHGLKGVRFMARVELSPAGLTYEIIDCLADNKVVGRRSYRCELSFERRTNGTLGAWLTYVPIKAEGICRP
jgi:hypothetical protein